MARQTPYRYRTFGKVSLGMALIVLPLVIWFQRRKQPFRELAWQFLTRITPGATDAHRVGLQPIPVNKSSNVAFAGLTNSAETLLIPLHIRAVDSRMPQPVLGDTKAAEIVNQLDYDFSRIKAKALSREGALLRAREFDHHVKDFLAKHPNGTVIELGCGLDTRFDRVDNDSVTWFDLDFPEVIALRRRFLEETSRHRFIGRSVLDNAWMDAFPAGQPVLLVAEAVFPYLAEDEVKRLFLKLMDRFPGSQIIFDGLPSILARMGGRLHPNLWHTRAQVRWGLGKALALEAWSRDIHPLGTHPYFVDGAKRFTGWGRALRRFPIFFRDFKVVRYQLGDLSTHP